MCKSHNAFNEVAILKLTQSYLINAILTLNNYSYAAGSCCALLFPSMKRFIYCGMLWWRSPPTMECCHEGNNWEVAQTFSLSLCSLLYVLTKGVPPPQAFLVKLWILWMTRSLVLNLSQWCSWLDWIALAASWPSSSACANCPNWHMHLKKALWSETFHDCVVIKISN